MGTLAKTDRREYRPKRGGISEWKQNDRAPLNRLGSPEKPGFREADSRKLAEREGFEPSERSRVHLISSQAHSASLAPLRTGGIGYAVSISCSIHSPPIDHRFGFQAKVDVIGASRRLATKAGRRSWADQSTAAQPSAKESDFPPPRPCSGAGSGTFKSSG